MSLAVFAAPFENNSNYKLINDEEDNSINKKRIAKNKTQKKRSLNENVNPKVLSAMQQIHSSINSDDNEEELNNFVPPPNAISAGSERISMRQELLESDNNENTISEDQYNSLYSKQYSSQYLPKTLLNDDYIDDSAYKTNLPNMNNVSNNSNGDIVDRMNYMIHLLEDQQGRKTDNVTEEIILYSFLGIFTIFVVDSFARVGKYVR